MRTLRVWALNNIRNAVRKEGVTDIERTCVQGFNYVFTACSYMLAVTYWGNNPAVAATPIKVDGLTDLSVGYDHICAIANGEVACWGSRSDSQVAQPVLNNPIAIEVGNNLMSR